MKCDCERYCNVNRWNDIRTDNDFMGCPNTPEVEYVSPLTKAEIHELAEFIAYIFSIKEDVENGNIDTCDECDGKGVVIRAVEFGAGVKRSTGDKCDKCVGIGLVSKEIDKDE